MDMDDVFSSFGDSEGDFPFGASLEEEVEAENELSQFTFKGEWEKVVDLYQTKAWVQRSVITSSKDTALHVAISDDREDVGEKLVASIVDNENKKALKMKNNRGETPLHRAATRMSVKMCECIVKAGQRLGLDLLSITNRWGETPVFTAALYNRKSAFIFLHRAASETSMGESPGKSYRFLRRAGGAGDTALHSAIEREHFDLAFHMIKMCPELMGKSNVMGTTPLHVLASKPSAFRSGLSLSWWKKIIYSCIHVDPLKYDPECALISTTSADNRQENKCPAPDNYLTCYQFLWGCYSVFSKFKDCMRGPATSSSEGKKKGMDPEAPYNPHVNKNIPQIYTTFYELLAFVYLTLFRFLGFEKIFNQIRKEKEKHEWSVQILKALMETHNEAYITEGRKLGTRKIFDPRQQNPPIDVRDQKVNEGDTGKKTPKEEPETYTPLLVAAQKGVIEVVNEVLSQLPVTIYDVTSKDKNILQVAVENRRPNVIEAVQKQVHKTLKLNLWSELIESVDIEGNTILHLAAKYEESMFHPWEIHGTATQMQWEIMWYEYVKSFSPQLFLSLGNSKGETPEQIFTRGHERLIKDTDQWLKDTSESSSVVAALVAGVSFATSSQVPGGNNGSGKPTLEGQPAFELFAITALIGLCFSVTALIIFLSLRDSRKVPKDFKKKLPLRILLGLSSLFVSIATMLVSFCAAHFFVVEDRFKTAVFPLYAATCLPVSFYAVIQLSLYMDLLKSIVIKVPPSLPSVHV